MWEVSGPTEICMKPIICMKSERKSPQSTTKNTILPFITCLGANSLAFFYVAIYNDNASGKRALIFIKQFYEDHMNVLNLLPSSSDVRRVKFVLIVLNTSLHSKFF